MARSDGTGPVDRLKPLVQRWSVSPIRIVASEELAGERRPLFGQRTGRRRPAGTAVPVTGIGQVSFDPVQIRVYDRPARRPVFLGAGMGLLPVAFRLPPQGLEWQA